MNKVRLSMLGTMKNYFADQIRRDLLHCVNAYHEKRPQLTKSYKIEVLAHIQAFGIFTKNLNVHGKFAKMASGSLPHIKDTNYTPVILREFYNYLFNK